MKEIKAIIQPIRLTHVLEALHDLGDLPSALVSECRSVMYQDGLYQEIRKSKVEIFVQEEAVERVVEAIAKAAHTGHVGDGRIFVIPIEDSVLIRTGERNDGVDKGDDER